MNYAKFIDAVKKGPSKEFNKLYLELFQMLCHYLRTTMRANVPDAEDAAQHALVKTVERIHKNGIKEPDSIYSYLVQGAKNRYLRILFENNRYNYQDNIEVYIPVEEQVDRLNTYEELETLDKCIEQLPEEWRRFMMYWMDYPDAHANDVARDFGISVNNVWTRKHRVLKKVSECIKKKLR